MAVLVSASDVFYGHRDQIPLEGIVITGTVEHIRMASHLLQQRRELRILIDLAQPVRVYTGKGRRKASLHCGVSLSSLSEALLACFDMESYLALKRHGNECVLFFGSFGQDFTDFSVRILKNELEKPLKDAIVAGHRSSCPRMKAVQRIFSAEQEPIFSDLSRYFAGQQSKWLTPYYLF